MIYVVTKPRKDGKGKLCCIVQASDVQQAKETVGVPTNVPEGEADYTGEWAGFTDAEVMTMITVKEGYIAKDL